MADYKPIPYLNTTDLSEWLRLKESTIRKMVCYNRIPYLKIGRSVRFVRAQIELWLKQNNPHNDEWQARLHEDEKSYNQPVR